jgi:hypothetical protein
MPESHGPYLSYAVICEKVLNEQDGVLSLIRLIDRVTVRVVTPSGAEVPAALLPPAPPIPITFVVGLKSGDYTGTVPVKVRIEAPSGYQWPEFETSAELRGEEAGANVVLPMQFPALDEGVHWFVVEVSGEVVTRVPLRIIKDVVSSTVPPGPS